MKALGTQKARKRQLSRTIILRQRNLIKSTRCGETVSLSEDAREIGKSLAIKVAKKLNLRLDV